MNGISTLFGVGAALLMWHLSSVAYGFRMPTWYLVLLVEIMAAAANLDFLITYWI